MNRFLALLRAAVLRPRPPGAAPRRRIERGKSRHRATVLKLLPPVRADGAYTE